MAVCRLQPSYGPTTLPCIPRLSYALYKVNKGLQHTVSPCRDGIGKPLHMGVTIEGACRGVDGGAVEGLERCDTRGRVQNVKSALSCPFGNNSENRNAFINIIYIYIHKTTR